MHVQRKDPTALAQVATPEAQLWVLEVHSLTSVTKPISQYVKTTKCIFSYCVYYAGNASHAGGDDNDDDEDQGKEDNYDYSNGGGDG